MFSKLLGLSALFVAFCGGFFSVKGIGLLFSGSFWAVIIMASSLEFGKIMATSFLYRYWEKINKLLKIYLISALIILMGITSLGVFGFLSQAFYATKANIDSIESQVVLLEAKKSSLNIQINNNMNRLKLLAETRKDQENNLTKALNQSTTTTITKSSGFFGGDKQETIIDKNSLELKSKTLSSMQENIFNLEANIKSINNINEYLNNQINNLDNEIIQLNKQVVSSDIGTYKFIAQAFNTSIERIVKWFILTIIIVFDPLAVALVLAYNISIGKKHNLINKEKIEIQVKNIENINNNTKVNNFNFKKFYEDLHKTFKRGTKKVHNEPLHDPNLRQNK